MRGQLETSEEMRLPMPGLLGAVRFALPSRHAHRGAVRKDSQLPEKLAGHHADDKTLRIHWSRVSRAADCRGDCPKLHELVGLRDARGLARGRTGHRCSEYGQPRGIWGTMASAADVVADYIGKPRPMAVLVRS